MNKRIVISILIILVLSSFAVLFFKFFEIEQKKVMVPPVREYYRNNYLALERWLAAAGITVNKDNWFSFETGYLREEKTIVIFDSKIWYYDEFSKDKLTDLSAGGKEILICLDNYYFIYEDNEFVNYLKEFGIAVGTTPDYYDYSDEKIPNLHWQFKFDILIENDYFTVRDFHNNIRIVKIDIGSGSLTILGYPLFMGNDYLNKEENANLTWKLIGENADETGVLFIHDFSEGKEKKSLFGTLMQRGNIIPVLFSAGILIIFGFWSVIPVFGLLKEEKQRNSRPIKDRFIAEISFLKKYKGLYYYDNAINSLRGNSDERKKT